MTTVPLVQGPLPSWGVNAASWRLERLKEENLEPAIKSVKQD